jgi:hypothetical protein
VVANGVVYAVGVDNISCEIFCAGTRHLFAFDGPGVQGCTGTPKRCDPLLHVAGTQDVKAFTEPVVANGVLYVGDGWFDPSACPVRIMHAFTS